MRGINDYKIPIHSIRMLMNLKQALLDDNDLSLKVTRCGSIAAAHHFDDLIEAALDLETDYHSLRNEYIAVREENRMYHELLGDRAPDQLLEEEKAQIQALVKGWEESDEDA